MPEVAVAAVANLGPPRRRVHAAGRVFSPDGKDRGLAALLTGTSWLLGRLPGMVVEDRRAELIQTLAQSQSLAVVIHCTPSPAVLVYDGERLLVQIPAR